MDDLGNKEILRILTDQNNNIADMLMDLLARVKVSKAPSPHPGSSAQTNELDTAMAQAQAGVQGAHKDSNNPFFRSKYADLSSCWDACREPLSKAGLSVKQFVEPHPDPYVIRLVTKLSHSSGQWESGVMEFRCQTREKQKDKEGNESSIWTDTLDPQTYGLIMTYARRYGLCAMVGIAPEDTDAEPKSSNCGQKYDNRPFKKATTTSEKKPEAPAPPSQSSQSAGNEQPGCLSPANVKKIRLSIEKSNITDEEKADILNTLKVDNIEDIPSSLFIKTTRLIAEAVKMREEGA